MIRTRKHTVQLAAPIFLAAALLHAVIEEGTVSKSSLTQCPVAPNGKLYLAPGC